MGEEASSEPPSPSPAPPAAPEPRLSVAKVIGPALEKIVRNTAWRGHGKLVQECKAAQERLASASPGTGQSEGQFHVKSFESPLFDGPLCYGATDAELILQPLITACDSQSAKVAEPALDCIQKLVAHGYLRGEVDAESGSEFLVLVQMMDNVCKAHELGEENVELLVLKTLLTAVTSTTLRVHGDCLLKAVRTCYNLYLDSKSVVNQTTAKASLTQMLVIVFRRMEADSSTVPVQPIVVTDLMEPADKAVSENNVLFVQSFITKVVQDIEVVLNPAPSRSTSMKHDGAFESTAAVNRDPADFLDSPDRDMLDAKYWEVSMYKNALEGRRGEFGESEADRDGDLDIQITNKLRRDAFLVFRAVCKLSMKTVAVEGASDNVSLRGKVLALELLKLLLENAGSVFRTSDRFLGAIKQYLCLSLLRNSAIHLMNIFQLSCSIFMSLLARFRAGLKAEIGIFMPMIILRVLENVAQPNFQQKVIVIRLIEKLCVDPQILVDIFVNYDCDVDSSNIFERLVNGLLKTAQGVPPGAETSLTPIQVAALKLAAMKTLVGILRSMGDWANKQLRLSDSSYIKAADTTDQSGENGSLASNSLQNSLEENGDAVESHAPSENFEVATFEQRRAYKIEFQEGVSRFNRKPSKGIQFLINAKKIGDSPQEIAKFLLSATGLDKNMIGDYLGENDELPLKVMHAYVESFNFQGMEFDEAIRSFLQGFRLPGEAQKIDRIMEKFAERYCKCNPKAFTSADTAYVLAYSVILLNTDAHNPMVKFKMTKQEFVKNNRGIDDGNDLPEEFMGALYDRIVKNEIKMKADNLVTTNKPSTNRMLGIENILNLVIRKPKEDKSFETSDDIIKHMQQQLKAKAGKSESAYYSPTDVEILRPMVEVTWAPMLAAFSVPLEKSDDEIITFQCLEGFRHAIHVTSVMCMRTERDAFVTSLAKFTSLHSPADIKQKNIDAMKAVIQVADEDGNYLREAWEHVLTCVSRFEHLHLIGEGAPPDATFFAAPQGDSDKGPQNSKTTVLPILKRKGPGRMQYAAAAARRGSYESAGVGGNRTSSVTAEQMNNLVSNLNMLEQIGSFEINKIFTRSDRLNGEAIVEFVKALCKVSMEELRSPTDPRVFSLTKIVEISHFNMNRIRLVWSRMWNVLADYFVTVGCSDNLSVAMYAMDSLRQLAMKFLDREELANYNFQNQFMKPFVVVMRKSSSVEIRELVIRCVSQMVFARVSRVKSGWKIMFMVFTTAATDEHKSIVLLAFETIEKIVREYFPYITETETTTFTDCVNCLIAFTNSRFNNDVSLNAIAFLRFCAHKLAEGELGAGTESEKNKTSGENPSEPAAFTDRDDHLHFWFPLLAGLSELTFDPRPEIRKSALEVLFDILRSHGHLFSSALWERVFDSVLLPLFDYVRRASDSEGDSIEGQAETEMDTWLYETCTLALQLVVDLFVKFYPVVAHLLGRILQLLTGFLKRPHQSLAAIGVAAFVRLMSNTGQLFSDEKWQEVLVALQEAAEATLPDVNRIVDCLDDIELQQAAAYGVRPPAEDPVAEEAHRLHLAVSNFKSRTAVQLLLVQAINEMYTNHGSRLSAEQTVVLLETLRKVAAHAHKVNSDVQLKTKLQQAKPSTQLSDPPLLKLESESYHAYLNLLQMLPVAKPELAQSKEVETRLIELCEEVLRVYLATAGRSDGDETTAKQQQQQQWSIPLSTSKKRELSARAPLVVSTLHAVGSLKESASVQKYLVRFFPLLATLISCEHGSEEVQLALSDMFSSLIGPILLQA